VFRPQGLCSPNLVQFPQWVGIDAAPMGRGQSLMSLVLVGMARVFGEWDVPLKSCL
jgi:hypothetical protein